jgi:hypothetical protein
MAWDGTETSDEGYFDPTFADDTSKAAILKACLFKLLAAGVTTVLEGASRVGMRCFVFKLQGG